jgi:histone-lysine N-methyltransferase SETMAR
MGKVDGSYYADEFRRLRQEITRKRRVKLTQGVLFLHENAPAHTSQVAMAAATDCGFEIFPHPPYSPDLAPSDFYLYPKLKTKLLEAMKVSWRRSMSSLRSKIENSILKG